MFRAYGTPLCYRLLRRRIEIRRYKIDRAYGSWMMLHGLTLTKQVVICFGIRHSLFVIARFGGGLKSVIR
jgi:hypothetical protein